MGRDLTPDQVEGAEIIGRLHSALSEADVHGVTIDVDPELRRVKLDMSYDTARRPPHIPCQWATTCSATSTEVTVLDARRLPVCSFHLHAALVRGLAYAGHLTDAVHHDLWDRFR